MTVTFAGLPVTGDVTKSNRSRVMQRPKEELEPLITALLFAPDVEAIRWRQYTPYFNDGDVCEFGVQDVYVRTADTDPEGGDYEDGFVGAWELRGPGHYDDKYTWVSEGEVHPAYAALKALGVISSGAFDHALIDLFGDHAEVTVTKDGIEVEYYEHD